VSCLPDQLSAIRQQPATGRSMIEGPGPPSTRCRTGGPTLRAPSMRCARVEPEKPARAHSGSAPRHRSGRHLRGERPAQSPAPKETTRRWLRPPLRVTTRGTHASRRHADEQPEPVRAGRPGSRRCRSATAAVLDPKRQRGTCAPARTHRSSGTPVAAPTPAAGSGRRRPAPAILRRRARGRRRRRRNRRATPPRLSQAALIAREIKARAIRAGSRRRRA
jgi:hypothetical protein